MLLESYREVLFEIMAENSELKSKIKEMADLIVEAEKKAEKELESSNYWYRECKRLEENKKPLTEIKDSVELVKADDGMDSSNLE